MIAVGVVETKVVAATGVAGTVVAVARMAASREEAEEGSVAAVDVAVARSEAPQDAPSQRVGQRSTQSESVNRAQDQLDVARGTSDRCLPTAG